MFLHLALDGVSDGSLGVGLDVVDAAARVVAAGLSPCPPTRGALTQRVLSVDGESVRSGAGRTIAVDGSLRRARLRAGDVLVLPGLSSTTERGLDRLLARADVVEAAALLGARAASRACVAASCSATFVLAASGRLNGGEATTTWWLAGAFARRFPAVDVRVERMVAESGGALTAGSAFAHADLMLALLARVTGPTLAQTVARYLVLDARPTQSRYMVLEHLRTDDDAVRAVERFVGENLHRQLSLDELARAGATSTRTLARRVRAALGLTPHGLVQRVRMQHAAHLLDTTRETVDEVAARVGYADTASFRRAFRKVVGASPRDHRASRAEARTD
jgi:transcriptional regulator GlxA family with amidase domain